MPVADQFWGDRYGIIEDPFGHRWSIATPQRVVPMSEAELHEAAQAVMSIQTEGSRHDHHHLSLRPGVNQLAASPDKDFVVVEGADHGQMPCGPCETVPGQYSNTVKNFYDYSAAWIKQRF